MTLFRKFSALRPTAGQTLDMYFSQLLEISTQLTGSEEAISDMMFKNHVYTTLSTTSRSRFFNPVLRSHFKRSLITSKNVC